MSSPFLIPALIAGGLVGYLASGQGSLSFLNAVTPSCNIKGNISLNTGERIYHVSGQRYYAETRVSLGKGERWFCSEEEARAAGWRRSRV